MNILTTTSKSSLLLAGMILAGATGLCPFASQAQATGDKKTEVQLSPEDLAPVEIWRQVLDRLSPPDQANALEACRTFRTWGNDLLKANISKTPRLSPEAFSRLLTMEDDPATLEANLEKLSWLQLSDLQWHLACRADTIENDTLLLEAMEENEKRFGNSSSLQPMILDQKARVEEGNAWVQSSQQLRKKLDERLHEVTAAIESLPARAKELSRRNGVLSDSEFAFLQVAIRSGVWPSVSGLPRLKQWTNYLKTVLTHLGVFTSTQIATIKESVEKDTHELLDSLNRHANRYVNLTTHPAQITAITRDLQRLPVWVSSSYDSYRKSAQHFSSLLVYHLANPRDPDSVQSRLKELLNWVRRGFIGKEEVEKVMAKISNHLSLPLLQAMMDETVCPEFAASARMHFEARQQAQH